MLALPFSESLVRKTLLERMVWLILSFWVAYCTYVMHDVLK